MTMTPSVHVDIVKYQVSCLPEEHRDRRHYTVTVERRGPGSWAVCGGRGCLSNRGTWDDELLVSNRSVAWLNAHRFDLGSALGLAREHAAKMSCMGVPVTEVLARDAANS